MNLLNGIEELVVITDQQQLSERVIDTALSFFNYRGHSVRVQLFNDAVELANRKLEGQCLVLFSVTDRPFTDVHTIPFIKEHLPDAIILTMKAEGDLVDIPALIRAGADRHLTIDDRLEVTLAKILFGMHEARPMYLGSERSVA